MSRPEPLKPVRRTILGPGEILLREGNPPHGAPPRGECPRETCGRRTGPFKALQDGERYMLAHEPEDLPEAAKRAAQDDLEELVPPLRGPNRPSALRRGRSARFPPGWWISPLAAIAITCLIIALGVLIATCTGCGPPPPIHSTEIIRNEPPRMTPQPVLRAAGLEMAAAEGDSSDTAFVTAWAKLTEMAGTTGLRDELDLVADRIAAAAVLGAPPPEPPEFDTASFRTIDPESMQEIIALAYTRSWIDRFQWPWTWLPEPVCLSTDVGDIYRLVHVERDGTPGAWYITGALICATRLDPMTLCLNVEAEWIRTWVTNGTVTADSVLTPLPPDPDDPWWTGDGGCFPETTSVQAGEPMVERARRLPRPRKARVDTTDANRGWRE